MIRIDWKEFKNFKQYSEKEGDNFEMLLQFLQSYYNMTSPTEMYDTMQDDDIAPMMLEKRDINCATDLESILYSHFD